MKILPSLASADQMRLGETIQSLKGHPYLHFDIEDGNFVPNITFGMKTIRLAMAMTTAKADAHLMVTNPLEYIDELAAHGFEAVAFHWESTGYPMRVIEAIHGKAMKAGIALNPYTPAYLIEPYLELVDYVLIMMSEPDGKGDLFQKNMISKISYLAEHGPRNLEIVVDGGIGAEEIHLVKAAGATAVVMGRAVFGSNDPVEAVKKYTKI